MADANGRITLWGMEVFLAAAEENSISAAARRLDASPSATSQQLTNLETALGTALLNRNERPMSLTPAGEIFLRRARIILNEAAQARAELAMQDLSALTQLRLGMIEDFDAHVTPRLLQEMAGEFSGAQFLLETGASHHLLGLLDTRGLDMVVAADIGAEADWMEVHPVLEEPIVAAVPRGAIAEGADVMAVLRQMPLIQYTSRHQLGRQVAAHLARQNLRLSHRFELDSYHAIMAMVAAGLGWTILTPLGVLAAHRFRDAADVLPLPFPPLTRTIALSARQGVLQDMPGQVAARLRALVGELVVGPGLERMPWLAGSLRVLDGDARH